MFLTVLLVAWAFTARYQGGPDEEMRYNVAKYIYQHHGALPRGEEESIRNEIWGISYAFYPVLSYMVSAAFMGVAGLFSTSSLVLLRAARMADVFFLVAASWFVIRSGRRLFPGERDKAWFFDVLVMFLPGYVFMGTYVNTDSLALMSAAVILYAWVRYLDEGWTWKNCTILAVGMALCFLSYYNAYGWILWSFVFFCVTVLTDPALSVGRRRRFWLSRGMYIAGITFGLAGWWFIRNFILYDGDILGMKACTLCGETYAQEKYRPSMHFTPRKMGWSLPGLLIYKDAGWPCIWTLMVMVSFVGTFGLFDIFMDLRVSFLYLLFLTAGGLGLFRMLWDFYWKKTEVCRWNQNFGTYTLRTKTVRILKERNERGIFHLMMAACIVTPVLLLISYAYNDDIQAQGRYVISAIFPVMYFVTCGYGKLLEFAVKRKELHRWFYRICSILWILGAFATYLFLIVPAYR